MFRRFNERAQSSPLGISLIVGITLVAAVAIVVLGTVALENSQRESSIGQAEQAMTQFDSRAAQVALDDSNSKTVTLGPGNYRVEEAAGSVTIRHENWDNDGTTETVYETKPLGALVYERDETTIAYQGGGVWRQDSSGDARMVSPPEFHYRSATLTFPVVHISGEAARSGETRASVARASPTKQIYPDTTTHYDDDSSNPTYSNPVSDGTVVVEIESEYCEGWRSYFLSRTDGEVSECIDDTVEAEIVSIGTQGDFDIIDGTLEVRGADTDTLDFEVTLTEEGADQNSGFNNHEWSMYGASNDDPNKLFEIHTEGGGGTSCGDPLVVTMFYSDDGGSTYQTWQNDEDFVLECPNGEDDEVTIDFLGDTEMEYVDSETLIYSDVAEQFDDTQPIGGNDPTPIGDLTRHYFDEMGDTDFEFDERQQGNAGIGDASHGTIFYDGDGRVITFLHITENEIEVDLE